MDHVINNNDNQDDRRFSNFTFAMNHDLQFQQATKGIQNSTTATSPSQEKNKIDVPYAIPSAEQNISNAK